MSCWFLDVPAGLLPWCIISFSERSISCLDPGCYCVKCTGGRAWWIDKAAAVISWSVHSHKQQCVLSVGLAETSSPVNLAVKAWDTAIRILMPSCSGDRPHAEQDVVRRCSCGQWQASCFVCHSPCCLGSTQPGSP